jgi:hypothetical protein
MEVSDLTAGVSVFAGHTVGFQPEYSLDGKSYRMHDRREQHRQANTDNLNEKGV